MIIGSLIIMGIGILTLALGFVMHFKELTFRSKILLIIGLFILLVGIVLLILGKAGVIE